MVGAWLVMLVLLLPGVAAGQLPIAPVAPLPGASIEISPRTPPPPTIPTAPNVAPPLPPSVTTRPVKTFDFRPTLGVSEEYTDNFNRTSRDPTSNFRSTVFPGFQVLLDSGFLTGQAAYILSAFHDSSDGHLGAHHQFTGHLAWQATPRLKLTLADALTNSDNPAQADRLNLRLARQEFTSNLLSLGSEYSLGTIDTTEYYRLSTFTSTQQTTTSHTLGATGSAPLGQIHVLTLGYEYLSSETGAGRADTLTFAGPSTNATTTGHQVTGSFSRDLTKDATAGVSVAYAAREQIGATGRTTFTRWNVSLFNNYVVPDKIVVRGSLGVAQLNSGASTGRLLLTSNTDIAYYLGPAVFGLVLERGFAETFDQGQNFGVVETSGISGSVSYRVSPLLTGRISLGYRENKFTGVGAAGQAARDDKIVTATANLTYQVLRWLAATMDYTYTESSGTQGGFTGFIENRVRAGLTVTLY